VLVAVRQISHVRVQIWQIMLGGAIVVLITEEIDPVSAVRAVNLDVMLFLFGAFIIGRGLEESGYLAHLSYQYFKKARTRDTLLLMILFGGGFGSAFLMNDTLAIIGTPVMLLLARRHEMSPKLLLLALAFAITTGSVCSPIGNPQNLLIALNGRVESPFITFVHFLLVPTGLCLLVAFVILRLSFPNDFHDVELKHSQEPIRDHRLASLSKISLVVLFSAIGLKILLSLSNGSREFSLTYIAVAASVPLIVGTPKRWQIVRTIDWPTMVFFAAMFVLMESVWRTGLFQQLIGGSRGPANSVEMIIGVSVLLSQFISNVPMVALYLPLLTQADGTNGAFMALAAGSTIAGNMLILGAASNVMIIQAAEKRKVAGLTFLEFAKVGVPLTLIQTVIYWGYLKLLE
jgi:Na+/H+ antiporter NhaD/arsenite permease-like protein